VYHSQTPLRRQQRLARKIFVVTFSAHNIRLDDGSYTKPDGGIPTGDNGTINSARRVLNLVFPGPKQGLKIADLGCLEGGYTVEFARLGFDALGIDVRESNIEACRHVQARVNLPTLRFVRDDVWNVEKYAPFDAIFCCGLLYHLDRPNAFLKLLSSVTRRVVILETHFSEERDAPSLIQPRRLRRALSRVLPLPQTATTTHRLSYLRTHEGLRGRWFREFLSQREFNDRENRKWASWDNRRSFWPQREYLLQAIAAAGFDLVFEQFDQLAPDIAESMTRGSYRRHGRGTFVGIKMPAANGAG
jgi:ubiquinone/menaquinone biosynthesis C-methylase UbiE